MFKLLKLTAYDVNTSIILMSMCCITKEEFDNLLTKPVVKINEDYDIELLHHENMIKMMNSFREELATRNLLGVRLENMSEDDRIWYNKYYVTVNLPPKKRQSLVKYCNISFKDEYCLFFEQYESIAEIIDDGYIKVVDVDENFYKTFNDNKLSLFNNCDIFNDVIINNTPTKGYFLKNNENKLRQYKFTK